MLQDKAEQLRYSYDANGNLLTDDSKHLDKTEYGRAAYPFNLQLVDQLNVTNIDYLYSANDLRIYKKSVLSVDGSILEEKEDYYLMDGFGKTVAIFHRQDDGQGPHESWEYFASGAERECRLTLNVDQKPGSNVNNTDIKFTNKQVNFFLYDHLGNTRVTYTPTGFSPGDPTVGVINEINTVVDYFPYGKVLREFVNGDQERYLTTQHERDTETDLDYRGARYYDNEVGRFLSLDPLAKQFASWSPYNYVLSNPVLLVDPDGKAPKRIERKLNRLVKRHARLSSKFKVNRARKVMGRIRNLREKHGGDGATGPKSQAVFDKRANDDRGENSLRGLTFERTIISENPGFNLVGYKAARMVAGSVDVFQVGVVGGVGFPPIPVWPNPNPFGQPVGTNVAVDPNGNIMDNNNPGTVLIPSLNEVDINDGLYQAGEIDQNGNVVASDSIIRLENVSSHENGVVVDPSLREERTDITAKVQGSN